MNLSLHYRKPLLAWFLLCVGWSGLAGAEGGERPWVLVDTEELTLSIMRGESPELVMEGIAIGRYGTTRTKRRGDNRTPLGGVRIAWIKWDSRFHRFIGLDYPNLEHGRRGFEAGRISAKQWRAIQKAHSDRDLPPQNTPLGGQIGLHGIGEGDLQMHRDFNWTHGCVALTNDQIDRLLQRVGLGTRLALEKLFAKQGIELEPYMELGGSEAIKQAVMGGLGISVLSMYSLRLELAGRHLVLLNVQSFPLERRWYAVHLSAKQLSLVAKTFLDFLSEESDRVLAEVSQSSER